MDKPQYQIPKLPIEARPETKELIEQFYTIGQLLFHQVDWPTGITNSLIERFNEGASIADLSQGVKYYSMFISVMQQAVTLIARAYANHSERLEPNEREKLEKAEIQREWELLEDEINRMFGGQ